MSAKKMIRRLLLSVSILSAGLGIIYLLLSSMWLYRLSSPPVGRQAPPVKQRRPAHPTSASPHDLPLTNKTQPLPHDGLFIRRKNEFGTKLDVGIKDLIDQGVLIDQTLIRFDDFIVSNSDRVPLPQSGQSLAVSYGIAPIPLSQKRDDRATHYLEIALRASDVAPAGHSKTKAPPVNYIFVIDTNGSMSGEKLDTVKAAIRELFKRMRKNDVLGIVEFNNQPRTLLKATPVGKISRKEFSRIISNITADGGTDLNIGLSYGIDEIGRYESDASLNHIFLFSDGQPTSGERDWIKIRQNVDKKTRGDIRLSTFAFGADANTRELDALASLTGEKFSFIADPTDTGSICRGSRYNCTVRMGKHLRPIGR